MNEAAERAWNTHTASGAYPIVTATHDAFVAGFEAAQVSGNAPRLKPVPTNEELRIIHAWIVPGKNPWYHGTQIARLKDRWPALAEAIIDLVRMYRP